MVLCGLCNSKVDRDVELKIQCNDCSKIFHGDCVPLQLADITFIQNEKKIWRCRTCVNLRKLNHNDTGCSSPPNPRAAASIKNSSSVQDINIFNEIKLLRSDFNGKLDKLCSDFKTLENNFNEKIDKLINENRALKLENEAISARLNILEQLHLNNCVDIIGVPRSNDEDVARIVTNLFEHGLNINLCANDVQAVYRKKSLSKCGPIHVRLSSTAIKNTVLNALKKRR